MITKRHLLASVGATIAVAVTPIRSLAEPLTVQMTGQSRYIMTGYDRFVIPTYHVNFITSQQATAAASIMSRVRLAMVLVGPDQATMRRLTNEAYADLKTQMTAAGLTVVPEAEAQAMVAAAGYRPIAGNVELTGIGPSITIGASVRKGWATFGPDAAPALEPFRNLRQTMGVAFGNVGATNALNRSLLAAGAIAVVPALTLDFVSMSASGGGMFSRGASANGRPGVAVTLDSPCAVHKPARAGPGTPGGLRPRRDVISTTPFAEVIQGGAEVRMNASLSDIADENYQRVARARGDAVVVDLTVWEGLIRDAYRAYNAAIVAAIVNERR